MKPNPVVWFEIYVQDMARARAFYEAVFATRLTPLESPGVTLWAFPMDMNGSGASGALVKMDGAASGGNSTLVYFHCEDCATEADRVAAAGGHIMKPKSSIGEYGHIALAYDPDGNVFGMHSMA